MFTEKLIQVRGITKTIFVPKKKNNIGAVSKLLVVEQKKILLEEAKTIIKVSTTIFHTCFIESRNCDLQLKKRKTVVYKNCIMLHIFKLNRFQPNYTRVD